MAPMSTRMLYSSGALRATMTGQSSERVMFTFDHWRRGRRGMAPPPSGTPKDPNAWFNLLPPFMGEKPLVQYWKRPTVVYQDNVKNLPL